MSSTLQQYLAKRKHGTPSGIYSVCGGATHSVKELDVTSTSAATYTLEVHKRVFQEQGFGEDAPDLPLKLHTYMNVPFGDMRLTASNTTGRPIEIESLRVLESTNEAISKGNGKASGDALVSLGGPASSDRVLSDIHRDKISSGEQTLLCRRETMRIVLGLSLHRQSKWRTRPQCT